MGQSRVEPDSDDAGIAAHDEVLEGSDISSMLPLRDKLYVTGYLVLSLRSCS
jgi:hypothetical protein